MTARITNCVSRFELFFLVLFASLFLAAGCATPKPAPNPLAGWNGVSTRGSKKLDQAIVSDYQEYIQKLRSKNYFIDENNIWFYEDATGQHAIRISIPLNGTEWEYLLIYDKDGKRIKIIKYISGYYRS
jgi:hypothetical protein